MSTETTTAVALLGLTAILGLLSLVSLLALISQIWRHDGEPFEVSGNWGGFGGGSAGWRMSRPMVSLLCTLFFGFCFAVSGVYSVQILSGAKKEKPDENKSQANQVIPGNSNSMHAVVNACPPPPAAPQLPRVTTNQSSVVATANANAQSKASASAGASQEAKCPPQDGKKN